MEGNFMNHCLAYEYTGESYVCIYKGRLGAQ